MHLQENDISRFDEEKKKWKKNQQANEDGYRLKW